MFRSLDGILTRVFNMQFLQGSERQRQDTANEIIDAFKNVGFVYLSEHGIPKDNVKNAFDMASALPSF
jgi:isopenicillin N synthase-like dioxygenase